MLIFGWELLIVSKVVGLKKRFYKIFIASLILVPLISNSLNFFVFNFKTSMGFSGVCSALIGMLFFIIIEYLNFTSNKKIHYRNLCFKFILFVIINLLITVFVNEIIAIVVNIITLTLLYVAKYGVFVKKIIKTQILNPTKMFFLIPSLLIPILFPLLFSVRITNGYFSGGLAHFIGVYFGIILPTIIKK